jgi:antibiotic biosynthesis monooxygenase (ABM) superfamily enzyme
MNKAIHIAITRRVKPEKEAEFRQALREFLQASFNHEGVVGAGMLEPAAGAANREYGILRTFASESARDDFYNSKLVKDWIERCKPLTEGEPKYSQLTGLEAWFRNPNSTPPPRWKMALLTFLAVWPVSMAVPAALTPLIGQHVPNVIFAGAVAAGIVVILTWVAMPLLVRLASSWLQPIFNPTKE